MASSCGAAASRFGTCRRHSARLDLKTNNLQAGREILGLRRMRVSFGEG
jgi:hypothetical protein